MILQGSELKKIEKFKDYSVEELEAKMEAIELAIRSHTHNNFQNRLIRFAGISKDNAIQGSNPYLKVGDTIEISQSVNNGLYVVKSVSNGLITLDKDVFDFNYNLVTKVSYPKDIVEGAIRILKYDLKIEDKEGVASESETISRHSTSTTYETVDGTNNIEGRPARLFGFCKPYINARF